MNSKTRRRLALTLAELVVMSGVGMLIFYGIIRVLTSGMRGAQHGMEKLGSLQDLALFLNTFQADARNLTKIQSFDTAKLVYLTSRYSKLENRKVLLEVTCEVAQTGSTLAGLDLKPRAISGGLPTDIMTRRFLSKNLRLARILDLKNDLGSNLPLKGFAFELELKDEHTGAKTEFRRSFFPPLLPENNREDGYTPLVEFN